MNRRSGRITFVLLCLSAFSLLRGSSVTAEEQPFRVMTWNIWHGGKEDGTEVGPQRVVEVIRDSKAELVAMQETYGSGEKIAAELGFHFHPRGTNVSLLSRFPIVADISVEDPFRCVGAIVELPDKKRLAVYSIWLPYAKEIWEEGTRPEDVQAWLNACAPSAKVLAEIRQQIDKKLADDGYIDVPLIIAGDFNSMSHLDYTAVARKDFQQFVDWPTSHVLTDAGYRDSYRELHPLVDRQADRTWTPRFPKQEQDRIDFIYYRGRQLQPTSSKVIDKHPQQFPSDHAAVVTEFRYVARPARPTAAPLNFLSYNIRHGAGMDGKVDLERTAKTIAGFEPDVVGLQEVDLDCKRSGSVNQPRELGRKLGMHAAFGRFMDLQGGRYGLAILSKYPLYDVRELELPRGNEPRVALVAKARLPDNREFLVVNVHLDWVDDDGYRFAQAETVRKFLDEQKLPFVLLGDFNDQPGSRTLKLFQETFVEADKPEQNRFTFSSTRPEIEIDFLFAHPQNRWEVGQAIVAEERETSDHRPVRAQLKLLP